MKKEKENKDKKKSILDNIKNPKIAILLSDEERMRKSMEKMVKEAADQATERILKERGN